MKKLRRKASLSLLIFALTMLVSKVALATATCTVNGEQVPCGEGFAAFGIGLMILVFILIVLGIIATVFWIMMLIHVLTNPIKDKPIWILIVLLLGFIGAIVYYFMVKRKYVKPTDANQNNNFNQPNPSNLSNPSNINQPQ